METVPYKIQIIDRKAEIEYTKHKNGGNFLSSGDPVAHKEKRKKNDGHDPAVYVGNHILPAAADRCGNGRKMISDEIKEIKIHLQLVWEGRGRCGGGLQSKNNGNERKRRKQKS